MATEAEFPDHALVSSFTLGGNGPRIVVKDCIDIAGKVTGCASRACAGTAPAAVHAPVVARLLEQGCRILGKANMHELAFGMTGINAHTGTPLNPNWPDRIPGGSSSGSAVAVAAGAVDFAVGTDTGGSIRQPAICCGIAGLKPSFGRIPRKGATPAESSLDCIGPFARDAAGIERAMQMMDADFHPAALSQVPRLHVLRGSCAPDVRAAFDAATDCIIAAEIDLPLIEEAFAAGMTLIAAETARAFAHLDPELIGRDVRERIARGAAIPPEAIAEAERLRRAFADEVDAALSHCDALIMPALPTIPPTLDEVRDPNTVLHLTRYLRPFNLSGHPALVLPLRTADALPAGLQLVGRIYDDARLCAIAKWIEPRLSARATKEMIA